MNQEISHKQSFKFVAPILWLFLASTAITGSSFFLMTSFGKASNGGNYGLLGAKSPDVMGTSFQAETADPRAIKINKVFDKFKCPMAGNGDFIVTSADENNIPYWLVPAVSFQESGCGKKTPNVTGVEESYNAWGYGVWGGRVKTFDSWEHGIATLSKYFAKNFYSKDITDLCEIMKTYTPPSKGSWCEGVKYFGEMIQNFESE